MLERTYRVTTVIDCSTTTRSGNSKYRARSSRKAAMPTFSSFMPYEAMPPRGIAPLDGRAIR
jgi:hypothetical protein